MHIHGDAGVPHVFTQSPAKRKDPWNCKRKAALCELRVLFKLQLGPLAETIQARGLKIAQQLLTVILPKA